MFLCSPTRDRIPDESLLLFPTYYLVVTFKDPSYFYAFPLIPLVLAASPHWPNSEWILEWIFLGVFSIPHQGATSHLPSEKQAFYPWLCTVRQANLHDQNFCLLPVPNSDETSHHRRDLDILSFYRKSPMIHPRI